MTPGDIKSLSEAVPQNKVASKQFIGTYEGAPIVVCEFGERIYLGSGCSVVALDKDAYRELLRFAEKIGWMAD